MKQWHILLGALLALSTTATEVAPGVGWREEFSKLKKEDGNNLPANWKLDGKKFMVPMTTFRVEDAPGKSTYGRVLAVDSRRSSGALITMPGVDLKKYPILRWRWRVKKLPPGADGRTDKDDQAVGIYFGAGGALSRKTIAYRWETLTPVGTEGTARYGGGIVKVNYQCLRNQDSPRDEWIEEERNVAEDFRKAYGYLPEADQYVISVSGNSQYTKSDALAEIDYLELADKPRNPQKDTKKTDGKEL